MNGPSKVTPAHLSRLAYLYIRQSTLHQVQENRESTARQYALKGRAQVLGWNSDQIVVIDEDLGLSGASASHRTGFQRLVADVGLDRVGLVMGLEVSRLARSSTDWHRLLEICALAGALILDEDGIYDPSQFNDRLLLGLKGTMSEAELHVLKARLLGGLLNKARRGDLWMWPPIGFITDEKRRIAIDPDEQVQSAVRLLFQTFRRAGSATRVVKEFRAQGIRWPQRIRKGPRAGELVFGDLDHSRALMVLHNPRYAGAYVYGRRRQRKIAIDGKLRYRRLPREEWKVFIPNAGPGYIAWEEYEANQVKLLANARARGMDRRRSPAREGVALLQGLVICGICGDRMTIRYEVRKGHPVPRYVCQRRGIMTAQPPCQSIPGASLDEAVSQVVLAAVTPATLEVALQVFEELRARKAEVDRLRMVQVERAREEAEHAQRQYMLVRPENRLVADSLERQWNEKLAQLRTVEEEYARAGKADGADLSADEKERIQALARDLPKVWNDPRTPARERKRMLRLLIDDVTLTRADNIRIHVRWKGGATTSLERPLPLTHAELVRTPAAIVELVRALATEKTDGDIAKTLNRRDLRSGTGMNFTRRVVMTIRRAYAIPSLAQCLRKQGWLDTGDMAKLLGVHHNTAKRFGREGVLRAVRTDAKGCLFFEPPTGSLPMTQPGKRFRDRRRYPPCAPIKRKEVQYAA